MFGQRRPDSSSHEAEEEKHDEETETSRNQPTRSSYSPADRPPAYNQPTKWQIKRATRPRFTWALLSSFLLLVAIPFLILVEIGSIYVNPILNNIYFLRLDLANIIPLSVPDATLINSIAQTIGLHDYYTVGLWGFCYGDYGSGFEYCSPPQTLYWFNPVAIIQSELLAGASIALPADIVQVLELIRIASQWMFALFLAGVCLSFVMIFLLPMAVYTRWASLPIMILTFVAALFNTVAAVLATVLFVVMANVITSQTSLNIGANIGLEMFIFMWIAAAVSIAAWIIQLSLCCCCASRRDIRTGRKRGSMKAWQ